MKRIVLIIAVLAIFCGSAHCLDHLPQNVYFRNSQQGMSYENYYALKDGKIWIKPNESATGIKGEWKLFEGTGIPFGNDVPSFKKNDRITEFATDGTMIVAVSGRRRFYLWQPTLKENTTWSEEIGAPFEDGLWLPENKVWSFGFSALRAPWKRLTPMHDIVSYWEDIDGNKTQFGLTATIYVAAPDGQKIFFTDTGLPATFNRAFTSPDRGAFVIENMSAAASTIFVINETGRMYTRMMDAEIEGGGPALKFTYKRGKRTDKVVPIMDAIRSMPLPDWRRQEPVAQVAGDKTGRAVITKNITIIQTGEGNAARELRVQGRNSNGHYGYYCKKIFDQDWKFKITGESFGNDVIIRNYLQDGIKGGKLDKTYAGSLKQLSAPSLKVELIDFYYFNSPATLRVHVNSKHFDMILHTVDQWVMTAQAKNTPESVGNPAGEPKLLQGTLEIPERVLNSSDPDIRRTVDKYFKRFNLIAYAFLIRADDRNVFIRSKRIQRASLAYMDYDFRRRVTMNLENTDPCGIVVPDQAFVKIAKSPELEIPKEWREMTGKDSSEITKLIRLNKNALWKIKYLNLKGKLKHFANGLLGIGASGFYYLCDTLMNIIGLPSYPALTDSPYINEELSEFAGLSYTGGDMVNQYAALNFRQAFKDPLDYVRAEDILKKRIKELKDLNGRLSETR
jgi:hypothetical protein